MEKRVAIITFLSISSKNEEIEYTVDGVFDESGNLLCESGVNTNDAPVKYLFSKAKKDNNIVETIVCIVSRKVFDGGNGDKNNATFAAFEQMINKKYNVKFEIVPYDFLLCDDECVDLDITQEEKASRICDGIIKSLKRYDEVYIDYTGGFRDTSFLTTVLIRYLEFINVKCKDIVYSNYQDRKIYSISYIYDIFKLINAVSQFVETGNGKLLYDVYNYEKNSNIKELIEIIYKFSQAISLCNIKEMDKYIEKLNEIIYALENVNDESKKLNEVMFYELLTVIKKKFYLKNKDTKFTYPKLIKWCLDNGLLQQALTLYVEKMPFVYFKEGIFEKLDYVNKKTRPEGWAEAEKFFSGIYEDIIVKNTEKSCITEFQEIIKKIINEANKIGIQNALETEEKRCSNYEMKKALSYTRFMLDKYYTGYDYKHCKNRNWFLYTILIQSQSGDVFLNDIASNSHMAYALIYRKTMECKTFAAKVEVLEQIEKGRYKIKDFINNNRTAVEILNMMRYYLAIKFMRNNINHASVDDIGDDTQKLRKYLNSKKIYCDISAKNIHNVLSRGLEVTHPELF